MTALSLLVVVVQLTMILTPMVLQSSSPARISSPTTTTTATRIVVVNAHDSMDEHDGSEDDDEEEEEENDDDEEEEDEECGLYLAPSTIPGAGLGMYSGKYKIREGEHVVPQNGGDVMIPLIEMEWHADSKNDENTTTTTGGEKKPYHMLWDEYTWSWSNFYGMEDEITEPGPISVASSGFGAAINCDLALINVAETDRDDLPMGENDPLWTYRVDASGVPSQSPGAGAFTIYHGRTFSAAKDIEPYSELYASYGQDYFTSRDAYWFVPLPRDYRKMDRFVKRYVSRLGLKIERAMESVSADREDSKKENDEGSINTNESSLQSDLWDVILNTRDIWRSRQMFALPGHGTTLNQLRHILENGGTSMKGYNATIKDANWMKEHGTCLDNIMDGVSSIPHAGRGAFARRNIKKGSVVAPAPLIHIPHKEVLDMYAPKYDEEGEYLHRDSVSGPVHQQLILNYCFGSSESELLLCPYGFLTGLINHSPNPNTEVRWTNSTATKHPEWFNQPVSEWGYNFHSGLGFDYKALRDIKKNEEITIDYGPEWQAAWAEHVERFEANPPRPDYMAAYELNSMLDFDVPIWPNQLRGVIMGCRNEYLELRGIFNSDDGETYEFVEPYLRGIEDELTYTGEFYLCRAIEKNEETNTYTVEVYESGGEEIPSNPYYETFEEAVQLILFDVPFDAFIWRDIPYERNHHQSWSFRHPMGFKDFPDIWKSNYGGEEQEL